MHLGEGRIFQGNPVPPGSEILKYHVQLIYNNPQKFQYPMPICSAALVTLRYAISQSLVSSRAIKYCEPYNTRVGRMSCSIYLNNCT